MPNKLPGGVFMLSSEAALSGCDKQDIELPRPPV